MTQEGNQNNYKSPNNNKDLHDNIINLQEKREIAQIVKRLDQGIEELEQIDAEIDRQSAETRKRFDEVMKLILEHLKYNIRHLHSVDQPKPDKEALKIKQKELRKWLAKEKKKMREEILSDEDVIE